MLDPRADIPRHTYYMLRNIPVFSKEKQRFDLTIIPALKLGREFNKTFGHIHQHNEPETYKLLLGKALFLLQKMAGSAMLEGDKPGLEDPNPGLKEFEQPPSIEKIKIIPAARGDVVKIPPGWHHETINIGNLPLVLVNWIPRKTENDYNLIEEMQGFGYYIIDSNDDGYELLENENYEKVPEPKFLSTK